ncbi:mug158 [Symbiodinium natans]|uniref:Mug158 protein n=1 Tax=Symbiodinium natans TaxID=878477 RepID=A0A812TZ55_9DINO|nr:mug158 [Symbiodinium natans]
MEYDKQVDPVKEEDFLPHVLAPCISETLSCDSEAAAAIMEDNLHWRHDMGAEDEELLRILQSAEIQDQLKKDDAQTMEETLKDNDKRNRQKQAMMNKIRTLRAKETGQQGCAKRKPVAFEPDRTYTTAQVNALLPDVYRSQKDTFNACWRIWARKGKWSASRSWGEEGCEAKCVHKLGRIVWARHCELHPNASCPFVFEFGEDPETEAASKPKAGKMPKASAGKASVSSSSVGNSK